MAWKRMVIDFFAYLLFKAGWSSSANSNGKRRISRWKYIWEHPEARWNYISQEWRKWLVVFIWVCINIGLFIEACVRWHDYLDGALKKLPAVSIDDRRVLTNYVALARGFGQLLNFNCALLIVPTMRTLMNVMRTLKLGALLPMEKNIVFHRFLAYWIVFCTIGHGFFHYLNYAQYYWAYTNTQTKVTNSIEACWVQKYGITGNLLVFVMYLMYATSHENYRKSKNYTVFWYTHHLFVIFFVLLLVHGKVFWIWFLGPAVLYLFERILRKVRGYEETIVKRVHCHPSRVLELVLEKPRFDYDAGQYCNIKCPLLSNHEWHAITISSAPEDEYLHFHIKCAGDWTNSMMDLFNPQQAPTVVIDRPTDIDNKHYLIQVDGPYGTSADEVYNYETIILVAAGIGATPYASLMRHFLHKLDAEKKGISKPLKIRKCFFYYINRDEGSWEWFGSLLNECESKYPEFFVINTFMTGALSADRIKQIYAASEEHQNKTNIEAENIMVRAMYSFVPESSDEMELHENDIIQVTQKDESGWWEGTNLTSHQKGIFPGSYVVHIDSVTKLRENRKRQYGRPDWDKELSLVKSTFETQEPSQKKHHKVGVFVCGAPTLSKDVYNYCLSNSTDNCKFVFHKENF